MASAAPVGRHGPARWYDRLAAAGAVYGVRNGWEVPNFFTAGPTPPKPLPGFARPYWFDAAGRECRAAARAAGILDLSDLAKFDVAGSAAATALGAVLHGALPDHDGGVCTMRDADRAWWVATLFTVVRLAADHFLLLGPGEHEARDADDLGRRVAPDRALFRNVTGAYSILLVTGPRAL